MPAATLGADRAGSSRAGFWLLQAQAETFLSNFLALLLILVHIFTNWHFKAADGFAFSFQKSCCGLVTQLWPSSFRVVLSVVSAIVFKIIICFWHQLESGIKSLSLQEERDEDPAALPAHFLLLARPFLAQVGALDPSSSTWLPLSWTGYLRVLHSSMSTGF